MIGRLPSTLEDRAVVLKMRRRLSGEHVDPIRQDTINIEMLPLRRRIVRWVKDNVHLLKCEPQVPPELHDRAADNWRPLFAIADAAVGDWPMKARDAAVKLLGALDQNEVSPEIQSLQDIRDLFANRPEGRMSSRVLVDQLVQMEDRPWPEWRNAQPMTTPQLAVELRPFGIKPKKIRFGEETLSGYEIDQFRETFARYLPEHTEPVAQGETPDGTRRAA